MSQDYFKGQSISQALENYIANTIIDTTSIRCVHATLESTKNTQKQGKPRHTYFVDLLLANALHIYDTKTFLDITPVGDIHTIFHTLKKIDPIA